MNGKELYRNQFEVSIQVELNHLFIKNKHTVFSVPKQKLKRRAKQMNKLLESLQDQEIESDEVMDEEYINALRSSKRYDENDVDQIESADEY
jgi:hypothetical protein